MRILITGGGGFIGSHIAEFYSQKEISNEIHLIDNLSRGKLLEPDTSLEYTYNWQYLQKYKNINFFQQNLQDSDSLNSLIKENSYDVIFHTAGQTAVSSSLIYPYSDFKNNVITTLNLLEAVRKSSSNPKLLLCSTNKVYGDNVNNIELVEKEHRYEFKDKDLKGFSEDFKIDLCHHSPYGTSKLCSDLYFQEYGYSYGLDTNIFRLSCIYGPRQFAEQGQGWLVHFIISALKGSKINIFGNGKQVRDILYVTDLINAFNSLLEKDMKNEIFCIGGGTNNAISIIEAIKYIEELLNVNIECEFLKCRSADQLVYISDISKAKRILDWNPKINPNEGIKKTIDWCKNNLNLFK